ncbi:MAG: tetratricopeptide repeat protein [Xanthomonadales bacterium]|nr:tetratricopeptide repeat protein [Xanthomonadales bacterium]
MTFWLLAGVLLLTTMAFIAWPALREARLRWLGISLVAVTVLAGLVGYPLVGTPEALDAPPPAVAAAPEADLDTLLTTLEERLYSGDGGIEGWLLLGRSLKTEQRYADAERVLTEAYRRFPGDPDIGAELAEARLFASGSPRFDDQAVEWLDASLAARPSQQKALWLRGLAARQRGNEPLAVELWQRLLAGVDPSSGVARVVGEQLAELGVSAGPAGGAAVAVRVEAAGAPETLRREGTLFVIVRDPGRPGPPVAVRRIAAPSWPVEIDIGDSDAVMPGTRLSDSQQVQVQARLSSSGLATPGEGDWVSTARQASVSAEPMEPMTLVIDQPWRGTGTAGTNTNEETSP